MKQNPAAIVAGSIFLSIGVVFLAVGIFLATILEAYMSPLYIVFILLGGSFTTLGGGLILGPIIKESVRKRLVYTGVQVYAEVREFESQLTVSVNGRCPYRAVLVYNEGGVQYIFKSAPYWRLPELTGAPATVYYDRRNMRRYYVDMSAAVVPTVEL